MGDGWQVLGARGGEKWHHGGVGCGLGADWRIRILGAVEDGLEWPVAWEKVNIEFGTQRWTDALYST